MKKVLVLLIVILALIIFGTLFFYLNFKKVPSGMQPNVQEEPKPLPDLSVFPDEFGRGLYKNKNQKFEYPIHITYRENEELNWKATTSQDWIKLSSYEGSTPSVIYLIVDSQKLNPGGYEGEVLVFSKDNRDNARVEVWICVHESETNLSKCP